MARGGGKVNIFVSYPREHREIAESLAVKLRNEGHKVFYDADLESGEGFDSRIRREIDKCHVAILLLSPRFFDPNRYTLSELRMLREKWPAPKGRILPISIEPFEMSAVPAYIKAVQIFEPKGNLTAEIIHEVRKLARKRWRPVARMVAAILVVVVVASAGLIYWDNSGWGAPVSETVSRWLEGPGSPSRSAFSEDSGARNMRFDVRYTCSTRYYDSHPESCQSAANGECQARGYSLGVGHDCDPDALTRPVLSTGQLAETRTVCWVDCFR